MLGLQFNKASKSMECMKFGVERESRSTRRVEVFVHRQDGQEIAAILTNISNHGCQFKSAAALALDEFVCVGPKSVPTSAMDL
jgi:hypothetical protein